MTIHLPEDLECYVHSQVQSGRFASEDEAITEAVRLLRQDSQQHRDEPTPLTEEELERRPLESGFLGATPPRHTPCSSRRDFQPVRIKGEPLSETVIRERR